MAALWNLDHFRQIEHALSLYHLSLRSGANPPKLVWYPE